MISLSLGMYVCVIDGKDLYIEKAVQKAYLEVTEEGAEGAVGSGMLLFYYLRNIFLSRTIANSTWCS